MVENKETPLIPFDVLDGPSQRLSVAIAFASLILWRLYDHHVLEAEASEALWLFMKWIVIDSTFVFGLPTLRVPWLQWPPWVTYFLFLTLAGLDAILMFDLGIPWQSWLFAITKYVYDRELAVDEIRVKRGNILHNSSLILGRQIVHILPEGSATLNPDHLPLCIGYSGAPVNLPIVINQTTPIFAEILRLDFESQSQEILSLQERELKRLKKKAEKESGSKSTELPLTLNYAVKKPGLYRLQKVVDKSKLEVHRSMSDTLVVECPTAFVDPVPESKCKGDLSDFNLVVRATPPFKVKYSKTINQQDSGTTFLTIHPDDLITPLARQKLSNALVSLDPQERSDLSWARSQTVRVPLNESLSASGGWSYTIDEVHDAVGNVVAYTSAEANHHRPALSLQGEPSRQSFDVYDRPRAQFEGCDANYGLKAEKGEPKEMPLRLTSTGQGPRLSLHIFSYSYSPFLASDTSQLSQEITYHDAGISPSGRGFLVTEPGLYTLLSVSAEGCLGEILEPSSCLLTNPPEPGLDIQSEPITDVCAKKSVGLLVSLDLTGTPPFHVSYNVRSGHNKVFPEVVEVKQLHEQLELKPAMEGHYIYEFLHVSDAVYRDPRPLRGSQYVLEQDVKPGVSARLIQAFSASSKRCLGEPFSVSVRLKGEGPWQLDYEIVHNGRRRKQREVEISNEFHSLDIASPTIGGTYTILLTGVTDSTGCKVAAADEINIEVSQSRPKVAFRKIEGSYELASLEELKVKLPLRLQGTPPWTIEYTNLNSSSQPNTVVVRDQNAYIEVQQRGTYELNNVADASCPGTVEASANRFNIEWIARPTVHFSDSSSIRYENGKYLKDDVCEGDHDAADVTFEGAPPFSAEYEQRLRLEQGTASANVYKIAAGLHNAAVQLDTAKPGIHEYEITKLEDHAYGHDPRHFARIRLQQNVHPLPSASFMDARKTYKHCKEQDAAGDAIPISLIGSPPFSLEIAIRQHAQAKPEIVHAPHVDGERYEFHIPHHALALGTQTVIIQNVRDARGCQRTYGLDGPSVRVSVADLPSISSIDAKSDYCVGEYLSYTLSGVPPFKVFYVFDSHSRKASSPTTNFRRVAERPGAFTITGVSDRRSTDECRANVSIVKEIHQMPNVRISKGRTSTVDIHEGGEVEILFEFGGTPPFEFT